MKRAMAIGAMVVLCSGIPDSVAAEDFPLRKEYPQVVPITTAGLADKFGDALVVDSRNEGEYNVIRIVGARNILVGDMQESDLRSLRGKEDSRPIVFYCNGITCAKSYKAAEKAMKWGFSSVFCYDAGIFAWAAAHPEKTELWGKVLGKDELKKALAHADADFQKSLLSSAEFLEKVRKGGYTLLDIRDPGERSEIPFQIAGARAMPIDTVIERIKAGSDTIPKVRLLIVDNVGKQGPWLNYYLRQYGFQYYHFLKGGIRQWQLDGYGPDGEKR